MNSIRLTGRHLVHSQRTRKVRILVCEYKDRHVVGQELLRLLTSWSVGATPTLDRKLVCPVAQQIEHVNELLVAFYCLFFAPIE